MQRAPYAGHRAPPIVKRPHWRAGYEGTPYPVPRGYTSAAQARESSLVSTRASCHVRSGRARRSGRRAEKTCVALAGQREGRTRQARRGRPPSRPLSRKRTGHDKPSSSVPPRREHVKREKVQSTVPFTDERLPPLYTYLWGRSRQRAWPTARWRRASWTELQSERVRENAPQYIPLYRS